jgi:hypothetical protein
MEDSAAMSDEDFLDTLLTTILDRSIDPIPEEPELSPERVTAMATRLAQIRDGINRVVRGQAGGGAANPAVVEELAAYVRQRGRRTHRTELRNGRVQALREHALEMIGTEAQPLLGVPVGRVPLASLNAAAIRSPSGGAVILLHAGLELQLEYFITCWEALRTRCPPAPTERPSREAEEALVGIGMIASDAPIDPAKLRVNAPFLFSLLSGEHDAYYFSLLHVYHAELFVLLHEYGHIALGHHVGAGTHALHLGHDTSVERFTYDQEREFAADAFACGVLARVHRGDPGTLTWKVICIGFLFMYLELSDTWNAVDYTSDGRTHPSPAERWARVCDLLTVDDPAWRFTEFMRVHMPYLRYYVEYHREWVRRLDSAAEP